MNPRIEEAQQVLADSKARYDALVQNIQSTCVHSTVGELSGTGSYSRRICVHCGLEEVGSGYSRGDYWHKADGKLISQDARWVKDMSLDQFCKFRV